MSSAEPLGGGAGSGGMCVTEGRPAEGQMEGWQPSKTLRNTRKQTESFCRVSCACQ